MALDPSDYIEDLTPTEPVAGDPAGQADDHIRAIKKAIRGSFGGGDWDGALATTLAILNGLEARVAALEAAPAPTLQSPAVGRENLSSGTGTVAVTGLGFAPKSIIVFASPDLTSYMTMSIGMASEADIIAGNCISVLADAEYPSGDKAHFTSSDVYKVWGNAGAPFVGARGDIDSWDADGFTIRKNSGAVGCDLVWVAFA